MIGLWGFLAAAVLAAPLTEDTAATDQQDDAVGAALAQAREMHKYVVVAVFGDNCDDCSEYQQNVFTDEGVAEWFKRRAVFVTISLDDPSGKAFAAKHDITAPPVILVLANDGRRLGRQIGKTSAAGLLVKLKGAIQSNRIIGGGPYKPWAGEDVVLEAIRQAGRFTAGGEYEEALAEFRWCLDHRVARSPLFPSQHLPNVIESLARLGDVYPPARDELLARAEQAGRSILKSRRPDTYMLYLLKHGNATLHREPETVELFRQLKKSRRGETIVELFAGLNFEALLGARMYDDLKYSVAEPEHVTTLLDEARNTRRPLYEIRRLLAARYEILLALGRQREAGDVAYKLITFDSSPKAQLALAEAALRSEKPIKENVTQARNAYLRIRSGDPHPVIVLAKLLAWVEPDSPECTRLLTGARRRYDTPEHMGALDVALNEVQAIRAEQIKRRANPAPLRSH